MSAMRSILARCITTLTVSGSLSRTTSAASAHFLAESARIAGDMVGGFLRAVLDRDLHVIEAGIGQQAQRLVGDTDRRGDEIGVEPGGMRGLGDLDEVAPRAGLAAGKMRLQYAEPGRLLEHARPGRGVEFVGARVECKRVRAVGAAKRTAVRQLGQQAERLVQRCGTVSGHATTPAAACPPSRAASRSRRYVCARAAR